LYENAISSIVSLPASIFQPYSSFSASIVILEKNSSKKQVYFADLRDVSVNEFEFRLEEFASDVRKGNKIDNISGIVDYKQLLNDASINLIPRKNILKQQVLTVDLSQSIKLKDLIKKKIKGVPVPLSNLNEERDGIPYIRISDSSDVTSLISDPIKYISDPEILNPNLKKIERGTVLLARIGNSIKPSVYEFDEPAIASPNLLCFTVDEARVKPEFLVKELQADYVKQQLQAIHINGTGPNYYRESDLLNLNILVPNIEEQQERIRVHDENVIHHLHNLQSRSINSFFELENGFGKGYESSVVTVQNKREVRAIREKEIISSIKHRISQYVSPISNDLQNLQLYHERKSREMAPISLEDKVSNRNNAITIQEVFNRVNENLRGIGQTFDLMNMILYYNEEDRNIEECNISDVISRAYQSVKDRMDGVTYSFLLYSAKNSCHLRQCR
jgi:hypothetical protein